MAFADPQTITIDSNPITLSRTGMGPNSGTYADGEGAYTLGVSHVTNKSRVRHTIRLDTKGMVVDPVNPSLMRQVSNSIYLVVNLPTNSGLSNADEKTIVDGFLAYLTANSGAVITKVLGSEI